MWTPALGTYLVEALKTVYEVEMNTNFHDRRSLVYYVFDMIHSSFGSNLPVREPFFMEKLKDLCKNGLQDFIGQVIEDLTLQEQDLEVSNLMNTTYDKFIKMNRSEKTIKCLENMKLIYLCMGGDFLLHHLKPMV